MLRFCDFQKRVVVLYPIIIIIGSLGCAQSDTNNNNKGQKEEEEEEKKKKDGTHVAKFQHKESFRKPRDDF